MFQGIRVNNSVLSVHTIYFAVVMNVKGLIMHMVVLSRCRCAPIQGMSIDDSELREYTHGLFGSIAAVMKQDFQPYLATCVSAALASCNQVSPPPAAVLLLPA